MMTKMPVRGWLALTAVLGAAACSPPVLPTPDASDDAAAEASSRPDVAADRTSMPDVVSRPDAAPDATPDVVSMPDAAADATPDATSMPDATPDAVSMDAADGSTPPPMDGSVADAGADARGDSAPDARGDAGPPTCSLTVDGMITLPAAGMTTTVNTTLNAMGTGGMIGSFACRTTTMGSERIYRLTVPTRTEVMVRLTATNASTDTALAIRRDCTDSMTEYACDDDSGPGLNSLARVTLDPGDYFIIADEYSFDAASATGGPITIDVTNIGPLAGNSTCAMPIAATGTMQTGNTLVGAIPMTTCSSFNNGPQLFYSYTIPANNLGTFVATPPMGSTLQPFVRVFADCASAATCLATGSSSAVGATATALYENRTGMAQTVIVSVGSNDGATTGTFTLTGTTMTLPAVPANSTCAMAENLALPVTGLVGTTVGATERRSVFSCATSATAGQLVYYSASVPAGRTVNFRVTPGTMTFNPDIRAFVGCMPTTCADTRDAAGPGAAETLNYWNSTATDQTVIFAVGSATDRNQGSFTVDAQLLPAAASNLTCAAARPLAAGTPATNQLQTTATTLSSATCLAGATGQVLYYSVSVPANTRATVTATTASDNADPVLRVRQDCATTACVASANIGFTGEDESVTWTNSTGSAVSYIVELGSDDPTTRGVFDVSVRFDDATPAYTVIPLMSASCEDLSMGATNLTFATTDDSASAITALPAGFNFPYFGDAMNVPTHFSVTTNGFMQLYASSMGTPSTSTGSSSGLPAATSPAGMLAAFWDDLIVAAPSVVRTTTIGAAPSRRFIVEWNNVSIFGRTGTDSLRFQIKLSEGSGIIEYHYCAMTSMDAMSTRHFGSSATIGLQNMPRSRGQTYLIDGTDTGMMGGMTRAVGGGTAMSPSLLRFLPM